ncbi:MAG TPA: glycosyltransferase, partial [Campylobacterales bacterium]|nr:glycosyltransferase [Campylobacterales bacterium]
PRFDHFRKKFLIPEDVTVFLYQGALSHGRGILQLVEVFKSIDKKAVVVFMGYGTLEPLIKEASHRYDTIFFHEAVSPDVLLEYTGSADVGLSLIEDTCLSYRYCLPNKMFEYIMVGIPIIVSDLPEMRKVVQEYGVGVIAQNGELGLTQVIEEAILLSKQAKKESFDRVRREYNWENQEKRLLEVYDAL